MTVVGPDGRPEESEWLQGEGAPDLEVVDMVAHRALDSSRSGRRLVLGDVEPELEDLLRLAGLPVEMEGQAEGGEEPLHIEKGQEERHLGDLPA